MNPTMNIYILYSLLFFLTIGEGLAQGLFYSEKLQLSFFQKQDSKI